MATPLILIAYLGSECAMCSGGRTGMLLFRVSGLTWNNTRELQIQYHLILLCLKYKYFLVSATHDTQFPILLIFIIYIVSPYNEGERHCSVCAWLSLITSCYWKAEFPGSPRSLQFLQHRRKTRCVLQCGFLSVNVHWYSISLHEDFEHGLYRTLSNLFWPSN